MESLASIAANPGMDVRKLYVIKLSELEYTLIQTHYENKFTKTFWPTNILHIFTKF